MSLRDLSCVASQKTLTEAILPMRAYWIDCFGGHLLSNPILHVSQRHGAVDFLLNIQIYPTWFIKIYNPQNTVIMVYCE